MHELLLLSEVMIKSSMTVSVMKRKRIKFMIFQLLHTWIVTTFFYRKCFLRLEITVPKNVTVSAVVLLGMINYCCSVMNKKTAAGLVAQALSDC